MRVSTVLVALPALAAAQEQIPFLDRFQPYIDQATEFGRSFSGSSGVGGSKTTAHPAVTELTLSNWEETIRHGGKHPAGNVEPWLVYVTGNKTCHGDCLKTDAAWDEAVVLFDDAKDSPNLALMDCDRQTILCGVWGAATATVWYLRVPKALPSQSTGPTALTIHPLNYTTVTTSDITDIHTKQLYLEQTPYDGFMHPLDGIVAHSGLQLPLSYFLFFMAKIPSPIFMIGLSFFSRYWVGQRMPGARQANQAAAAAPAGGAAAKKNR